MLKLGYNLKIMETLLNTSRELVGQLGEIYLRQAYEQLDSEHRLVGIVGPRGIGKTTYLLHSLKKAQLKGVEGTYFSADHLYFTQNTLLGFADQWVKRYDGRLLCIDEIHRYSNWAQELKNIYDQFPQLKILFSGSSSIDLIQQKYDLSRRASLKHLEGFSFREYLEFTLGKNFPILSLNQLTKNSVEEHKEIYRLPKILGLFEDYLKQGYYPFSSLFNQKSDFFEGLLNSVDKVIYTDIASYYSLKTGTLNVLRKILYFVATSSPPSINIHRLAQSLGKDHGSVADYLQMLRDSGLLRYLLVNKTGHALIRKPEKIYLNNTNLMYAMVQNLGKTVEVGALRELFVLNMLENAGHKVFFSREGNFICEGTTLEIGGPGKTRKQVKEVEKAFVVKEGLLYPNKGVIPLYLFGFLY